MPPTVVATLFEPAPPPKPVVGKLRREPYKPPAPVKAEKKLVAPKTDWAERLALLPRDANGNVDWVPALEQRLIEPKSAIPPPQGSESMPAGGAPAEEQPELDLDVELVPKDAPDFKATYPHKIHTQLLACANCHTGIFQMEKGADPITMEKIFAGEYCGRCHGKVAFDVATGCPRCHKGMPR